MTTDINTLIVILLAIFTAIMFGIQLRINRIVYKRLNNLNRLTECHSEILNIRRRYEFERGNNAETPTDEEERTERTA